MGNPVNQGGYDKIKAKASWHATRRRSSSILSWNVLDRQY